MDTTYPGRRPPTPLGRLQTAAGLDLTVAAVGPDNDDELYAASVGGVGEALVVHSFGEAWRL